MGMAVLLCKSRGSATIYVPWKSHENPMASSWGHHGRIMEGPLKHSGREVPWKSHRIPRICHENTLVVPRKHHENVMAVPAIWKPHPRSLRKSHQGPMGLPSGSPNVQWKKHRSSMGVPQKHNGSPMGGPWTSHGTPWEN